MIKDGCTKLKTLIVKPKDFSDKEAEVVVDAFNDIAQIIFAAWFITPIFNQNYRTYLMMLGAILPFACWYVSILLTYKFKKKHG